jgi:hypothetical protein
MKWSESLPYKLIITAQKVLSLIFNSDFSSFHSLELIKNYKTDMHSIDTLLGCRLTDFATEAFVIFLSHTMQVFI